MLQHSRQKSRSCKRICKEIKRFWRVDIDFHPVTSSHLVGNIWRERGGSFIPFYSTSYHTIPYHPCYTLTDTRLYYVGHYSLRHQVVFVQWTEPSQGKYSVFSDGFWGGDYDLFRAICPFHCLVYETWERSQYPPQRSPLKHSALYIVAHC